MSIQRPSDPATDREAELVLELFGTRVRLLAGGPPEGGRAPEAALAGVESMLREMHDRLTRFDPDSELSGLNSSHAEQVDASDFLVLGVEAALRAAERSEGLIDPVMIEALEDVGYARSKAEMQSASLREALEVAPEREPARPRADSLWREIQVDAASHQISRPPGMRIDLGGIGKGLAADLAAGQLEGFSSWCADIGGDLRLGGSAGLDREVGVTHPLTGEMEIVFPLSQGAVATSGISRRVWKAPGEGGYAHHLLNPSTGLPAWTGVIQATAVAGSAQEAETLSKMALLAGPERGEAILAEVAGGALVLDSGEVRACGSLAGRLGRGSAGSTAKVASEA